MWLRSRTDGGAEPICSHSLNSRSIVLSAEDVITIQPLDVERKPQSAVFDGRSGAGLEPGDAVEIRRSGKVHLFDSAGQCPVFGKSEKENGSYLKSGKKNTRQEWRRKMKLERHSKIRNRFGKYEIETQEELAEHLKEEGYQVTQATISRDIRS